MGFVAILATSVLMMASCATGAKLEQLKGTWEVVEVNGMAVNNPEITLGFNPQAGYMGGFLGCNNVSATFDINEDRGELDLDDVMMLSNNACPTAPTEALIFQALDRVDRFEVSADNQEANLMDDHKAVVLKLRKVSETFEMSLNSVAPAAPQVVATTIDKGNLEGDWRIIRVRDMVVADLQGLSSAPTITFDIANLKFSGNASCNTFNGKLEFDHPTDSDYDAREIEFENIGLTRMACENMELENALMKVLDDIDSFAQLEDGVIAFYDDEVLVLKIHK